MVKKIKKGKKQRPVKAISTFDAHAQWEKENDK